MRDLGLRRGDLLCVDPWTAPLPPSGQRGFSCCAVRVILRDRNASGEGSAWLARAFGIERPVTRRLFPAWDLPLVLRSLRIAPYEPLSDALLQDVTKKTVFLLALASGKRRGELAALLADNLHLQFARDNSSVTLIPDVLFRGKTQRSDMAAVPWTVPALTPFVGQDEPDRLMCPVRALRWYLQKTSTNPLRGPRS